MTMTATIINGETVYVMPERPLEQRLYRTPYLVLPRLAIEAMPVEWQKRLEALLAEADDTNMETPDYHVLRDDRAFTLMRRYDDDDPESRPYEFTAVYEDPWANYRRGDVKALNPEFKGAA